MTAVIEFAGVTVRRGRSDAARRRRLGRSRRTSAGCVLGPNGAGKTTLLQVAARPAAPDVRGGRHPRRGARHDDVFDLRPRIGLTSAALADRIPRGELVRDVVVSASYGVARPLARGLRRARPRPRRPLLGRGRRRPPGRAHLRHPQRGRAQARPDRPGPDDRPRAAAARRAGGRAWTSAAARTSSRPCPCSPSTPTRRRPCWSPTTWRRSRRASPTRCCCARGAWSTPARSSASSPRRRCRRPSGCRCC